MCGVCVCVQQITNKMSQKNNKYKGTPDQNATTRKTSAKKYPKKSAAAASSLPMMLMMMADEQGPLDPSRKPPFLKNKTTKNEKKNLARVPLHNAQEQGVRFRV